MRFGTGHVETGSTCAPTSQCLGIAHASSQSSATTASATISSGRDGSVASAAASSVQPAAAVSACRRRSRASITAMTTSSRCKPSPQHQWRPWPRSCARVPWGDHGACRVCVVVRRGMHNLGLSTAQPPMGARCAALGRCARAAQLGGCVPHQHASRQGDLRSTPTIGTARGAGQTSIIRMQPRRPRCAARQVNQRTHSNSRHSSTLPMWEGWDQSRYQCGSGEPSPGAD